MARFATLAAALGALSAVWTIVIIPLSVLPSPACGPIVCASLHNTGWVVESLAVVLLIVSAACFVGPRTLFYVSSMLSAVLAGAVYVLTDFTVVVAVTLALYAAALIFGLVAARRETSVTEQGHPMNLPVFG